MKIPYGQTHSTAFLSTNQWNTVFCRNVKFSQIVNGFYWPVNFLGATKAARPTSAHVDGMRLAGASHGYLGEGLTHFTGSACSLPSVDWLNAGMHVSRGCFYANTHRNAGTCSAWHSHVCTPLHTHICIHMEGHLCIHKAVYPHAHTHRHCAHVHEPMQT